MIVAVPRETAPGERRVALAPEAVVRLSKSGIAVHVETGAGDEAGFPDAAFRNVGAEIAPDAKALYAAANIVVRVQKPATSELAMLAPGVTLIGFLNPLGNPEYVRELAERKITAFAMETIPRVTRAQAMDALSSQSNIAGYKSVLIAASVLPRFFPMLTTAAGTVPPAKVLILGAGVAGLQAIATARRLGAIVTAYDTRAVVKEQVQSLGAEFLELDLGVDASASGGYAKALDTDTTERQQSFLAERLSAWDVVITTASVPGGRAPVLLTEEAVKNMKPGSVIVDLAAESGGNCALTEAGKTVVASHVSVVGAVNLPATVPQHASQLYARNIVSLLGLLVKDGALKLDFDDEIVRGACIAHDGKVLHPAAVKALGLAEEAAVAAAGGSST